jgi:hypothetical protein
MAPVNHYDILKFIIFDNSPKALLQVQRYETQVERKQHQVPL